MSFDGAGPLAWKKMQGLLPAVVQDADTQQVLMLGYMNQEALEQTRESGLVTFYSRSKDRLWQKGESSGHVLRLVQIHSDCDDDALLVLARPQGATCHRGTASCFTEEAAPGLGFLGFLWRLIDERFHERPEGSYTSKLFAAGVQRMAQKVGEEGVEVALAAMVEDHEALAGEAADLFYHLFVLLRGYGLPVEKVFAVLRSRHSS